VKSCICFSSRCLFVAFVEFDVVSVGSCIYIALEAKWWLGVVGVWVGGGCMWKVLSHLSMLCFSCCRSVACACTRVARVCVVFDDSLVENGQQTSYGSCGAGAVGGVGAQEVCDAAFGCAVPCGG
jgi:hypothetical protein